MYKGIVLNEIQRNAFLSMAAQEGLICEKGMTDGVFDKITHSTPSFQCAKMLLEQFAVAGAVYVDPFIYRCMDGEMIEKKIIMPYQKCEDSVEGLFTFDIDTVQQMLSEKGYDINYYTTDRIDKIYKEWKEKVEFFLRFEDEYNINYNEICCLKILGLTPKTDYSNIDIDRFIELGDFIYHHPIFKVLIEYRELFNIAYNNELLSPVINATYVSSRTSKNNSVLEGTKAINILKYTSARLNRIYTASSLKDTIKLVQSDEAKAYRQKVDDWITAFSKQNFENMQMIEDDILNAQKAMKFKGIIENIGKVCATIGVATAIITPISPPMGIVSTMATYVGYPTAFLNPTKRYLWASFGVHNR